MHNKKIAAVIVTFNRLVLLKECIISLKSQKLKIDEIFIINNSSTDGTKEWLNDQNDLTVITQKNSGGAGGFYSGIRTAYEKNYDWIWCMDDDGKPTQDTLEKLYLASKIKNDYKVFGCLVLNNDNPLKLSFLTPIFINGNHITSVNFINELKYYADSDNMLYDFASFFNGVFIHRSVIEDCGYPLKELFIWGDEVEYMNRIKKRGWKMLTYSDASFYHPQNRWSVGKKILNQETFDGEYDKKAYYYFRNRGYLASKSSRFYNIRFVIAQIIYIVKYKKLKIRFIIFFLKAYFNGARGKLNNY